MNIDLLPQEEIVSLCQTLIQTPSANGQDHELAAANVIVEFAEKHGLPVETIALEPERPCVLVRVGPPEKTGLLLVGHIDTVPAGEESQWEFPPYEGKIVQDRLYGRGAIDTKGGITAALAALLLLKDHHQKQALEKSILLICVPDEESGATGRLGVKYLHSLGKLQGEGAIYTYPDMDKINIGHRGVLRYKISTTGKSFHTGSMEWQNEDKSLNAVSGMAEIILALEALTFTHQTSHALFDGLKTVITATMLNGGTGPSVVPNHCEAFLDIRMIPDVAKHEVETAVYKTLDEIKKKRPGLKISISEVIDLPPTSIAEDSKILQALLPAAQEQLGFMPKIQISGPANESYLLNELGIPTCTLGPTGEGAHALDEYVDIPSIFIAAKIYAETGLIMSKQKT